MPRDGAGGPAGKEKGEGRRSRGVERCVVAGLSLSNRFSSHFIRSMMVSAIQQVNDMDAGKHSYPMVIRTMVNMNTV